MSQPNEGQDRLDYLETSDITEVHASIAREHAEPSADVTPIPTWLSILCAGALCWAGIYVGIFHGGFNPKVFNEYESNPTAFFPLPGNATVGPGAAVVGSGRPTPRLFDDESGFAQRLGCPAHQCLTRLRARPTRP